MRRLTATLVASSAALLLLALPASAAPRHAAEAHASIVRGTTASISQFPWLAHVDYEGKVDAFQCTGTVVAPRVVLTAGHCVISEAGHLVSPAGFRVITGVADVREAQPANVSRVAKTVVAPGFDSETLRHDAALLLLEAPVAAPPIALAGPADAGLYAAGTPISIAGWGLTNGRSSKPPPRLKEAETVIQDPAFCRRAIKHNPISYTAELQLCAIAAPRLDVTSCHGDSGGPGIAHRSDGTPVEVGVISFGLIGDCDPRNPEYQTRVDAVSAWIGQWVDSIEHGAPAPETYVPPLLRLPPLSILQAKYLDYEAMAYVFRNRFLHGKYKQIACRQIDREKVKCRVFWYRARQVYIGSITTYLALPREGSLVNFRYRIHRYSAACWVRARNPRTCPGPLFYN